MNHRVVEPALIVEDACASIDSQELPVTRIEPPTGWRLLNVHELWRFRELIYFLVWRDIKVRYKQTVLGAAWAILQPLLLMLVFTLVFGRMGHLPSGDYPYPLFVLAGLLPWTFFSSAISSSSNSIVAQERLVTRIYFPRLAIPLASVGAAALDFLIALGLLAVFMAYYGLAPGLNLLLVPAIFAVIFLAALGVGTGLAALNVAYRDFRYVVPFTVQLWMFATPTIYMETKNLGEGTLALLFVLNPMTELISAFRSACLGGPIYWPGLLAASLCAMLAFLIGCFYFRKVEGFFADII